MKQIVTQGELKAYLYVGKIGTVEVSRTPPIDDWCVYPAYLVRINGWEESFLYNGSQLFLERTNPKTTEERKQHTEEAKKLEAEGKTQEEVEAFIKWKWTIYVDRVEYIIDSPDNLKDILEKAILALN